MILLGAVLLLLCGVAVRGTAPHNDTSGFSRACDVRYASSVGLLSEHVKAFSPEEEFSKDTKKELIVLSANSQVLPLAINLLKSMSSLDMAADGGRQIRILIIVFNDEAMTWCNKMHLPCFWSKGLFKSMGMHKMSSDYEKYGSDEFKTITLSLTHIIGWFLREGWTVFNTDVDIVWLKSPYKPPHSILDYDNDVAIGGNNAPYFKRTDDINTGFYRVQPSEWSTIFFEKMFHECKDSGVDDQDCMKKKLKAGGDRSMAHITFLNQTDYPISGCVWRMMKDSDKKERAHLFHAACMNGMAEKLGFMNDNGMLRCSRLRKAWMDVERKVGWPTNDDGAGALTTTLNQIDKLMLTDKAPATLVEVLNAC